MSRPLGGSANRRVNALIATATAQIARHRGIDLGVCWRRGFGKQRSGVHDLASLAVAALRHTEIAPRHLHGVIALGVKALDRNYLFARHLRHLDRAGTYGLAVDMHRTGATQRHAAAELGPGETKFVAQVPQERHRGVAPECAFLSIDLDVDHCISSRWEPAAHPIFYLQ